MAELLATRASRGHRPLWLPIAEETNRRIVGIPTEFRRAIDPCFRQSRELFPVGFARGYQLKDDRMSANQRLRMRRIILRDGTAYSIRPSFLMPSLTARTEGVDGPLFMREFGVPFWALARAFGGDAMSWDRRECAPGRFSVAGTTVRQAELPASVLADEHHQTRDGKEVYIATTVGGGCVLGAGPADAAGADRVGVASGVFKDEARDLTPEYAPKTVSTGGWPGAQAAWKALFPRVALLLCTLHAWLKIRDRGKHLKEVFAEIARRVWGAHHAPDRRHLGQRLRRLRQWATVHLTGVVPEKVLDVCAKRERWSLAHRHAEGHRTSTRLDRQMGG